MQNKERQMLKQKKRVVIKIGSSSLTHPETGALNLLKIERLIRLISDLRGEGREVVLVSSGAIAAGRQALGHTRKPDSLPQARFIGLVPEITPEFLSMGKSTSGSSVGTGGMSAKLAAARIATDSGADMVIANGDHVEVIQQIMAGEEKGTLFLAHPNLDFDLMHYLNSEY